MSEWYASRMTPRFASSVSLSLAAASTLAPPEMSIVSAGGLHSAFADDWRTVPAILAGVAVLPPRAATDLRRPPPVLQDSNAVVEAASHCICSNFDEDFVDSLPGSIDFILHIFELALVDHGDAEQAYPQPCEGERQRGRS